MLIALFFQLLSASIPGGTVSAGSAAEWVMHYEVVEESGATHDMRTRNILIVRGDRMYLLGYAGPAADTADFDAFDGVVSSLKFGK